MKTEKQDNASEVSSLNSTQTDCALQGHDKSNTPTEENLEHHDASGSVPSESPLGSTDAMSPGLRGSPASSCEGARAASTLGPNSSHGRLSSCSAVRITEEQLKLNPVKPEVGRGGKKTQLFFWLVNKSIIICLIHPQPRQAREEGPEENHELPTSQQAQPAESQRQDAVKKRRAKQEVERRQREEMMRSELEEERRKRAENLRFDCKNQPITTLS